MSGRSRVTLLTLSVCVMVLVTASPGQSKRGYTATVVEDGGVITGVVRFDGEIPSRESVTVTTTEEVCHRDPIHSEKLVVSEDRKVRWVVVSVEDIAEGKPFPDPSGKEDKTPKLDQSGCVYRPHVVLVPEGKTLRLLNSDGILHNVHTWPKKNRSKNLAMPGPIKEMQVKFRRAESIRVTCDIHTWMEAWIVVCEHPYYAVTDENGNFKLTDVPPGTYTLRIWHETLGVMKQDVTVKPNEETEVESTLRQR